MIGIFDSGFGGLTILRALGQLPLNPDIIYLGDNGRAPYGQRSGAEIVALTRANVDYLFHQGCRLVILACNTAATAALRPLQQNWLPHRSSPHPVNILGIVVPTIEQATGMDWAEMNPRTMSTDPHRLALFATSRTVDSHVYDIEIAKRRPDIHLISEACPGLAGLIEAGAAFGDLKAQVDQHVAALLGRCGTHRPAKAILGCTHYPLIAGLFSSALGPQIGLVDQAQAVADSLARYLVRHPEYALQGQGRHLYLSTGYSPDALDRIESYWGSPLPFEKIAPPPV
jgi:glutamate racemase